ncbi:MAG TPA: glycosyltransferase [Luteolibacter sp.]|nr:glycosyltransferase [Luteolibacter sp.]
MRISIIVPAFNEERLLAASLTAIRTAAAVFSERGWAHELIVCDNNSTDRTAEIARAAGARVVFEPVNQIARARNTGAAAASGEWLVFIDADSRPDPALFGEVAERIESGRVLAGGVTIRMDNGKWTARIITALWNLVSRTGKLVAGSFIFVEAAAFREIGGFSHDWYAGEELELCRRLKKPARKTKRQIVILHRHPIHTSGRKIDLYSPWETLCMLARAVFTGGRSLRSRETTHLWYDGRR